MWFFHNNIIFVPVVAYVVATSLKALYFLHIKEFSLKRVLWTGGMPSGHSAFVMSLSTAIGMKNGFSDDLFALSLVFSAIVIYDAMNIRFQSGLHAKAINNIANKKEPFNESLGHLPSEAIMGGLVGIIVAVLLIH